MQLIVITPPDNALRLRQETQTANELFKSGLGTLHLRKPEWSPVQLMQYVEAIHERYRKRIMIHSHHGLVEEMGLKGRHFPERDCPEFPLPHEPNIVLSTSFHSLSIGPVEDYGSLDYAFLSPVFDSISKPGYTGEFSQEDLQACISGTSLPLVALGGITSQNIEHVKELGFWGAAVLGYIWSCEDPVSRLEQLLSACRE